MNSIKSYIPIVVVCLKACVIELLCHSLCIWLYLYLRWRRSYYIVFLSETSELHLYLMWRGSWILCQLGPQSSALLAPQGQVLGIQRAASNLEQNRVCIWGFYICICIFSPVFALEIRGSVCEHLPGTKGPSARHHPQEAGGERNQSNQIPNSNWIKRKTLLVHFLISGYLSTPLCHENQVYKHFPFDYIPSPYLGRFLEAVQRAGKGRNVHSHCSSHQLQLFWKKYISSR